MIESKQGSFKLIPLLAAIAVVGSTAIAHAQQIRIWPTAVVDGDVVTLSDVAELQGFDSETLQRLGALVVHGAPESGGELVVTVHDVRGALGESDANLAEIRVFGALRSTVSRPRTAAPVATPNLLKPAIPVQEEVENKPAPLSHEKPDGDSLEAQLREFILSRLPKGEGSIDVRFSPTAKDCLALKSPMYKFKIRSTDKARLGLVSLSVDIRKKGQEPRTIPVVAEVLLVREVVVARRAINQGQLIEGRDVKLEERRFSSIDAVGLTNMAAAIGKQASQFLRTDEMLQGKLLRAEPLVARNQPVKILIRADGLEIRTSGKAQQGGALGETISVRRDGFGRKGEVIDAVVSGAGVVTLVEPLQVAKK